MAARSRGLCHRSGVYQCSTSSSVVLTPLLAGQARLRWLLFPIRAHVDLVAAAALGADQARAKPRDLSISRIVRHVDQRGVPAGIVETRRNQVLHAELAHVAERHRRAGGVPGIHSMTSSEHRRNFSPASQGLSARDIATVTPSDWLA